MEDTTLKLSDLVATLNFAIGSIDNVVKDIQVLIVKCGGEEEDDAPSEDWEPAEWSDSIQNSSGDTLIKLACTMGVSLTRKNWIDDNGMWSAPCYEWYHEKSEYEGVKYSLKDAVEDAAIALEVYNAEAGKINLTKLEGEWE